MFEKLKAILSFNKTKKSTKPIKKPKKKKTKRNKKVVRYNQSLNRKMRKIR